MEHYLIIARSITQAQRFESTLSKAGIPSRLFRAPRGLAEWGCAYAVQISERSLPQALTALHRGGLSPVKIYLSNQEGYREAVL